MKRKNDQAGDQAGDQGEDGVRCPDCGCRHCPVYYTRQRAAGRTIRRRECRTCGRRFLTVERVAGGD